MPKHSCVIIRLKTYTLNTWFNGIFINMRVAKTFHCMHWLKHSDTAAVKAKAPTTQHFTFFSAAAFSDGPPGVMVATTAATPLHTPLCYPIKMAETILPACYIIKAHSKS